MCRRGVGGVLGTLTILSVLSGHAALAGDGSWNKIRYQGGTVDAKVNPFDWNTTLGVSSGKIELVFAGRKRFKIEASNVVTLAHGERACRRMTAKLDISSAPGPVPLFGIVSLGKDHLVGIEFKSSDGTRGAVLIAVHKGSYRDLLQALSRLTGKPVEDAP
ncbi:MAG: hypothetical protein ABFD89_21835 [Bryobacteraceae bacterium]